MWISSAAKFNLKFYFGHDPSISNDNDDNMVCVIVSALTIVKFLCDLKFHREDNFSGEFIEKSFKCD